MASTADVFLPGRIPFSKNGQRRTLSRRLVRQSATNGRFATVLTICDAAGECEPITMSRLFVGNFSFEQAWDAGHNSTRQVQRLEAELACVWLAVAQDGDEIFCPEELPAEYWDRMAVLGCVQVRPLTPTELQSSRARELVPWGWTPEVRRLAEKLRMPISAPPQETIWLANSREFAFRISQQIGWTLPGEGIARSLAEATELISKLASTPLGWIVKPNQGQAGRGQIRGNELPSGKTLATLDRLLQRQGSVHVEPCLERVREFSGQWEIPPTGAPELLGFTQLTTDSRGVYQGTDLNCVDLSDNARENLKQAQYAAVLRLQAVGYWGPVGIDAMLWQDGQSFNLRPIQDINARWTMGRIGWEWGQHWKNRHGESTISGSWCHQPLAPRDSAISLSPEQIAGLPVRNRTWWSGWEGLEKRG